ncbi:MAG: MFS transporter [Planctomycetota bacterium]|jgi:MFS family permease
MRPEERANALKCTACDGLHGVGVGLVSALTVLPLLFRLLGAGEVELGLLYSVATAGFIVGQPLGLLVLGRRRRTKAFLVPWVFCVWVPAHLVFAVAVYFLGHTDARLCRHLMLVLIALVTLCDGMIIPIWIDWQGALFSRRSRGRAMGMIAGAWALGNAAAALAAGRLNELLPFPLNYSLLFLWAGLFFAVSVVLLWQVGEPDSITEDDALFRTADLFGFLGQSLRQRNFCSYLVSRMFLTLGSGAVAFYAVHFRSPEGGGLTEGTVIKLGALVALAQAVSSYVLGAVGDRVGHKRAMAFGYLAQVLAIAVAYLGQGWTACAGCFALLGVSVSAAWVSHNNMLLETCPHESRVAHITLSSIVLGPFMALTPLGTGWLMRHVGIRGGIGLTLIPTVLGVLWLLLGVREPRTMEGLASRSLPDQT